ncbi:hypothetical protein DNTS_027341 [Danionella cerebrum]|uniref:EF-hand domain-containing protein n=1 Tax=Danionella cerebrum TaxID=2873325 RepID=A0A553MXU9_9TELE|nr:hypothetical protein DNTS_027341 [Danionella translucida]
MKAVVLPWLTANATSPLEVAASERLMDGARDQYEERLKEVFESFDGSGVGSLSAEELSDLCRALQLDENTLDTLLHTLLDEQSSARVDFEQFKDALILVLSSTKSNDQGESLEEQDSQEIQPRFVKGSKRYGRRSAPEFTHTHSDTQAEDEDEKEEEDDNVQENDDRAVPRKREIVSPSETIQAISAVETEPNQILDAIRLSSACHRVNERSASFKTLEPWL